jgi:hypothetical protein
MIDIREYQGPIVVKYNLDGTTHSFSASQWGWAEPNAEIQLAHGEVIKRTTNGFLDDYCGMKTEITTPDGTPLGIVEENA